MVELLFVAHNRLAFTRATFEALLDNTDWDTVEYLHVCDDRSRDGTYEFLHEAVRAIPVPCALTSNSFGGPVAAMLHAAARCKTEFLAKVDNDTIVCPGWLNTLLTVMEAEPRLDVLGFEPGFARAVQPIEVPRTLLPAVHVGGQALIRTRVFRRGRLRPSERFHGWTKHQRHECECGWVDPDIACFNLDHLPFEPWRSLAADFVRRGWARPWGKYDPGMSDYWAWWLRDRVAVA